jgi:DNA-binding CsgD family transcriptional regulator
MTRISTKHWETIIDVIHTANANLEDFDTFRRQVLEALQTVIRNDTCTFFLFDENLHPFDPIAINIREKYLRLYQEHFYRFNHFDPTHGCLKARPAIADSVLFHSSAFKKSYIYNEFFKTHDIQRQLVLYLKSNQRMLGFIGLHRSDENAGFKEWELAVAETVVPLLSQSLEKAQVFQQTKSNQAYFEAILNRTSVGVLMLGITLEPLFINRMAGELFARMKQMGMAVRGPEDKARNIPLLAFETCRELKRRMPAIRNPLPMPTLKKTLKLSDDDIYTINAEIFDHPAAGIPTPLFLVTFEKETPRRGRINEQKLKQEMGFTKREIELIHYLFKGLKNNEIADLLCITEGTVKNHLRNIFEKMGVTNRTSLIYEILSL